jgi:hypothetical protein
MLIRAEKNNEKDLKLRENCIVKGPKIVRCSYSPKDVAEKVIFTRQKLP